MLRSLALAAVATCALFTPALALAPAGRGWQLPRLAAPQPQLYSDLAKRFGVNPLRPSQNPVLAQQNNPTWTILVYVHADHNLEDVSFDDIAEMAQVGSSERFKIIVQWDIASEDGVRRAEVWRNANGSPSIKFVQDLPELNSDDPKNIENFVSWGLKTYPAERIGLVMWDHGDQWYGYGGDDSPPSNGVGIAPLHDAISNAMKANKLAQFDFFSFDACLMGGIELLAQFGNLSKLYIAAPEIDFGDGWDYSATLAFLKANPGASLREFGQAEVKAWADHHSQGLSDRQRRMQVAYDTSQVPALLESLRQFNNNLQLAASVSSHRIWL
jgi:hypothetical protein